MVESDQDCADHILHSHLGRNNPKLGRWAPANQTLLTLGPSWKVCQVHFDNRSLRYRLLRAHLPRGDDRLLHTPSRGQKEKTGGDCSS